MTKEQIRKIRWLERAKTANKTAEHLKEIYEEKKVKVTALKNAYRLSEGRNPTKRNTAETAIIDMLEAEKKWKEKADYVEKLKAEIRGVSDTLLADILKSRYIDFCTHKQTAKKFNYSLQHTKRLHKKALNALKDETF